MLFGDAQHDAAELVVLSLLAEGAQYGYAITKEAAARSEGRLRLTPGVLYPLLKELEGGGLIASSWEEVKAERSDPEQAGRRRKWYRLTPKGRRRLAKGVDAHRTWRAVLDAFIGGGGRKEPAS